jgi:hypothetical protein
VEGPAVAVTAADTEASEAIRDADVEHHAPFPA